MGFVQRYQTDNTEIEELKRMLVACAGLQRRKDGEEFKEQRNVVPNGINGGDDRDGEEKLVCVTSGVSFFGLALVSCLLRRGYSVRVIVDHHEDTEGLTEVMRRTWNDNVSMVTAKLTEVDELAAAFEGCGGVFHTSAFADPAGLSGYSKSMAEVEVKTTENVMKACASAAMRNCVLTSSLLACIWRDPSLHNLSPVVNHESWSDESLCINRKLWYALGKLKSEKAAWKIAEENNLNLVTICPGLITGPDLIHKSSTATIAYLKGAQEMYSDGLLATVDVMRLAEAHICVYESMNKTKTAFGRYICYDRIVASHSEAEDLAKDTGTAASKICGSAYSDHLISRPFQLSKRKLTSLMSSTLRHCYTESLIE